MENLDDPHHRTGIRQWLVPFIYIIIHFIGGYFIDCFFFCLGRDEATKALEELSTFKSM